MDYQLAKELKEAGFPQKRISVIVGNEDRFIPDPAHLDEYLYIPTLEELIAACLKRGENMVELHGTFSLTTIGKRWVAGWEKYETFNPECWGGSPIEAVANLYLALHPKKGNQA